MSVQNPFLLVLKKYRTISFSESDKGDRFERLMQLYLQTDPKYSFQFKHVWMWNDFPGKNDRDLKSPYYPPFNPMENPQRRG